MKKLIKRILQEQSEEWIDISPEDYYDLLKYVNGNGSLIKKIPQYKGKKINITGDLDLSGDNKVSTNYYDYILTNESKILELKSLY